MRILHILRTRESVPEALEAMNALQGPEDPEPRTLALEDVEEQPERARALLDALQQAERVVCW